MSKWPNLFIFLMALSFMLVGCGERHVKPPAPGTNASGYWIWYYHSQKISEISPIVIEGHRYLVTEEGHIIHAESCLCNPREMTVVVTNIAWRTNWIMEWKQ